MVRKRQIEVIQPSRSSAVILLLAQLDVCQKLDAMSGFLIMVEYARSARAFASGSRNPFSSNLARYPNYVAPSGELVRRPLGRL